MMLGGPGKRCVVLMNQSSRDHTLLDVRPSPDPERGAVSSQSSKDKHRKRSLLGSTVRKEGRAMSIVEMFATDTAAETPPARRSRRPLLIAAIAVVLLALPFVTAG